MMEIIGPKPRWEYRKIELLNELNGDLSKEAEENGWKLNGSYTVNMPDLDSGCDPMNVHGWIQNMLDLTEGNLAGVTEEILKEHPESLETLKDAAYRFGYRHASEAGDALSAYQMVDDVVLNGMPCDDVNEITEQSETNVSWYEKEDMHSKYWHDGSVYRQLRNAVINGLLAKSPVVYAYDDNHQSIRRNQDSL